MRDAPRSVTRATDIDEKNITYARSNIILNNLKSRIRPFHTKPNDPLIPLDAFGLERYASMTIAIPACLQLRQDRLLHVQSAVLRFHGRSPIVNSGQVQTATFGVYWRRY